MKVFWKGIFSSKKAFFLKISLFPGNKFFFHRALEKVALKSKSRRGSKGSYENSSVRLTKTEIKLLLIISWNNMLSLIDFKTKFVMLFNDKVSKNALKHEIVWLFSNRYWFNCFFGFFSNFLSSLLMKRILVLSFFPMKSKCDSWFNLLKSLWLTVQRWNE